MGPRRRHLTCYTAGMSKTRDDKAHDLACSTPLSFGEAWHLLQRVGDDDRLAVLLVMTGQAFNLSPWSVIMRLENRSAA